MLIKSSEEEPPANKKTKKVIEIIISVIMSITIFSCLILITKLTFKK